MERAFHDSSAELERCKEQRKAALDQQQDTHKLLANMQVQCAQTLDQIKKNVSSSMAALATDIHLLLVVHVSK